MERWHRALAILAVSALALMFGHVARADSGQFIGEWRNLDTTSRGLVRLSVAFERDRVRVRAFSHCEPDPCDLGWVDGAAYATSPGANLFDSADAITATFKERYAERLLILWPFERDRLKAELLTRFTGANASTNTRAVYIFRRTSADVSGLPGGRSNGSCVAFNPETVRVQRFAGAQWKVVSDGRPLLDFGGNQDNAFRAQDVIKHYGLSRQCFLGKPDPVLQYFLVGDRPPSGWLASEDCVGFNQARLGVRQMDGRWTVGEGDTVLVDTGGDRAEAEHALGLIRRYAFTNLCYVGRPNPPMVYFRR
ncbi:MAG: hypothetical protein ACM3N5_02890 [Candidatus Eiseniibacteriota bacterium]